jgi:hypothetical protein
MNDKVELWGDELLNHYCEVYGGSWFGFYHLRYKAWVNYAKRIEINLN